MKIDLANITIFGVTSLGFMPLTTTFSTLCCFRFSLCGWILGWLLCGGFALTLANIIYCSRFVTFYSLFFYAFLYIRKLLQVLEIDLRFIAMLV